ncbi:putative Ig domain-containing protein [Brucella sp. 22210]|uniref:putative Ig domain-containing protein n=1 Tax=Brucella sp. 22210 TaxID=3453892 RepID=UPI003F837ADE
MHTEQSKNRITLSFTERNDAFRKVDSSQIRDVNHSIFLLFFALLFIITVSTFASAASIASLSADRSTYTFPGTVITFTMSFHTDNRAWNGAEFSDQGGHSFSQVLCPAGNNATNQQITCTFQYAVKASDLSNDLEFIPEVTISGLDTATYSGVLRVAYKAPDAANISVTSSPNPSTLNQAVTIIATVTSNTGYTPTGLVEISNDDYSIIETVTLVNGSATLTTTHLVAPTDNIYAVYYGDTYNGGGEASITHTVNAGLLLTATPASTMTVGEAYSQANTATGGTAPYNFAISGGALPNGLSINSATGLVSGTPTLAGPFSYTVQVTDRTAPTPSTASYTTTGTIARANQIISFDQPANTSIATNSILLSASSSSGLPVTFYSSTTGICTVSGSIVTLVAAGTCSISADQPGDVNYLAASTVTRDFTVSPTLPGAPTISSITVPVGGDSAQSGSATISFAPPAFNGGSPITQYTVISNPGGLMATGTSSPLTVSDLIFGTAYTFTVTARNAAGSGTASASSVSVTPIKTQTIRFDNPGSRTFGTTTTLVATATSNLAVSFESLTTNICQIVTTTSVTAKAPGTCTVRASQAGSAAYQAATDVTQSFAITVPGGVVSMATTSLPAPTRGIAYSQTLLASNGAPPYSFTVSTGTLPNGLTLSPSGNLSGIVTSTGSSTFSIQVTDQAGQTATQSYSFTIIAPAFAFSPTSLPKGTGGVIYPATTVAASGGIAQYSYAVTAGALPNGLTLSPAGVISGTPSAAGTFPFTITATDTYGVTGAQAYFMTIGAPALSITPATLPSGMGSETYNQTFTVSGGTAPYSFAIASGELPPGIALAPDGQLSGRPTQAGNFTFDLKITDDLGFTEIVRFSISVSAPTIAVSPSNLPAVVGGTAYKQVFSASGGTGPYSFAVSDGKLPSGLSLKADGSLSGVPDEAGAFAIVLTATDKDGFKGTANYTLSVNAPVPVVQNQVMELTAGTTGRVSLTKGASGGPFTGAALIQQPGVDEGSAYIDQEAGDYVLVFAAAPTLSQAVTIRYSLSNNWGTSAPAEVRFSITSLSDPALDTEVTGLVNAQISSAQRFAAAQITNYRGRLEQLHDEGDRRANSFGMGIGKSRDNEELAYLPQKEADPVARALERMAKTERQQDLQLAPRSGEDSSKLAFWSGGFVNFGSRDDNGTDLDHTLVGMTVGADYKFSSSFIAGIGMGYGRDVTDVGNNGTRNKGQAFSAALYGSYKPMNRVFVDALVGYSFLDFDSNRFVTDTSDFANGQRNGNQVFGSLSLSYEHRADSLLLSPYGSIDASWSKLDGFSESGADLYNLRFDDQNTKTVSAILGLRAEYAIAMDWAMLRPKGRVEYTHDFTGSSRASMGYADLSNGFPYTFNSDPTERDYL